MKGFKAGRVGSYTPKTPTTPIVRTEMNQLLGNVTGFVLVGLTVLAVLHPRCVIVIPKSRLWASFIGRFTDCDFYIEQQSLPVKFTCAAWRQCMWLYEEYVSLRRDVEVIENGKETFTVTITACPEDKDESNSCLEEESTGYIFHLDGDGELRSLVRNLH